MEEVFYRKITYYGEVYSMKQIGLQEIRREYLDFFEEKEHLVAPSFSLIPKNDKSLLLIGAGMAPLKKYFTGEAIAPRKRMSTCQKCIRTGDIENVGKTDRHATFFEMLGNFSFGDYFKREAIEWAWEFLTERMEIPKEDLWISVYEEDQEAYDLWKDEIGVPQERIVKLGKEDNFWELEVGPSGPCSEIYVDRGESYGCGSDSCRPGCDCDRFIEVWNLVFTQFDKDEEGVYHRLASPNIDTGMGLERITAVMEKADNIFEIKEIQKIINKIEEKSNYKYKSDNNKDVSVRVITDHCRAMTFLVSDGVLPSNEGRGYVLRRLIRRAARHGKLLGIQGEFLNYIVNLVIDLWKVEYRELEEKRENINKIIKAEEDKFQETIDQGIEILEKYIQDMTTSKEDTLNGELAFKLYDTYGFPLDLTKEILEERSLKVDENQFNEKMEEQKNRARMARENKDNSGWGSKEDEGLYEGLESHFKGYTEESLTTRVCGLIKDGARISSLKAGQEGIIVLTETPFYGESGGQIGDTGRLKGENSQVEVLDTRLSKDGLILHMVKVVDGEINLDDMVTAMVDQTRRKAIRKNHTATHILHKALKDVLGDHVNQAGSLVLDNRFRFDFTHFESLKEDEILRIEDLVNEKIMEALELEVIETSLEEAQKIGAVGLFEDKYSDSVRIIRVGEFSQELCGGTHVKNTADIGMFKILSEAGIASGVRRIEAITGVEVYKYMRRLEDSMDSISQTLKTNKNNILEKANSLMEDLKAKEKQVESLKAKLAKDIAQDIISSKKDIDGISVITYKLENMDMDSLRNLGDEVKQGLESSVIVLASIVGDKLTFLSMVSKDLNKKGLLAGNIVREVAKATGGNGGGRPDMAQAGGKDISKVDEALDMVYNLVKEQKK